MSHPFHIQTGRQIAPPPCWGIRSLVEEILVFVRVEIGLSAGLAAKRLTVTNLLEIVEAAGDALITGAIESVEGNAGTTVDTGINLGTAHDRIAVCVHNAGSIGGVGVDEVRIGVGSIVRSLKVAITKRSLQNGERRYGLAVALELRFAFLVGSFDSGLNLGNSASVGLRDDKADAVLRSAAVNGLRLPDICVAPAGFRPVMTFMGFTGFTFLLIIVFLHKISFCIIHDRAFVAFRYKCGFALRLFDIGRQ